MTWMSLIRHSYRTVSVFDNESKMWHELNFQLFRILCYFSQYINDNGSLSMNLSLSNKLRCLSSQRVVIANRQVQWVQILFHLPPLDRHLSMKMWQRWSRTAEIRNGRIVVRFSILPSLCRKQFKWRIIIFPRRSRRRFKHFSKSIFTIKCEYFCVSCPTTTRHKMAPFGVFF